VTKCDYCLWPSEVRCKTHRQHICGRMYCIQLHRYGRGNCVYVDPAKSDWMGLLAALTALSLTAAAFAWVHLWRVM
jgi:hypothetical protein